MIRLEKRKNIIITGKPGSGKSTLLAKIKTLLSSSSIKIGGISTPEIRESGIRKGFNIIDIATNEKGILAHLNQKSGPMIGKYRVNLDDLDRIGSNAIQNALINCDAIIIDEIGKMELFSQTFQAAVLQAVNSDKVVLASMGQNISHPLIHSIKTNPTVRILTITKENRDQLFSDICDILTQLIPLRT